MGYFFTIFLVLLSFSSCQHLQQKELLVEEPTLRRLDDYRKPTFTETFFGESHFNYSNNPLKPADTTKHFYSSETIIINDTTKYFLRNCKALKRNDSVLLQLSDTPFSESLYELTILKHNNQFSTNYYQTFSITDSSYKKPVFHTIYQNILLDKKEYRKGDSLKGKVVLKISAYHTWDTVYTDTIKIYGLIKTVVE